MFESSAMASNKQMATANPAIWGENIEVNPRNQSGIGCFPMTLSTATLRGSGESNASGIEIRLSNVMPERCNQHDRDCAITRQ
jgi:hypothetical protein